MPISSLEHLPATESLDLKTRNELQIELIKRSGRPPSEWIKENSPIFAEIIQDPDIVELIKYDRKKALEEIEKLIKEKKITL